MARLADSARPRFAAGCRWGSQGENRVVLYPEGMLRVRATGLSILSLCDGERTIEQIVAALSERYPGAGPLRMREDVEAFLEALRQKRIVDY